jgi:hypothetical protein
MFMELRTQKLMVVFEAVNDTLHESFIGATSLPMSLVERRHQEHRPDLVAHWEPEHRISYRCVESGLSAQEAPTFLLGYAQTATRFGWKTFVDDLQ